MRRAAFVLFLLGALCLAQAPIPDEQVPQRTQIFANKRVSASRLDLKPGELAPMHVHTLDTLVVFLTKGATNNASPSRPVFKDVVWPGLSRYRSGPYTHALRNDANTPFRAVVVSVLDKQGELDRTMKPKKSHYCNPGSKTVCVDEAELFCTAKVCVEDVTMAPGAVTTKHSHTTDHMLVAVSDYQLTDVVEGKGTTVRTRKSGEVEYIPAGITHQLTNTGKAPAHFTVILWR